MVADVGSWKKDGDTYTGTLYMLPDRGWNTEGSVDYAGRLQKFTIAMKPRHRDALRLVGVRIFFFQPRADCRHLRLRLRQINAFF